MKPDVVVDIGNSRIKWGLCIDGSVERMARLPVDDPRAWDKQADSWDLFSKRQWVLASVQPETLTRHVEWVRGRGGMVHVLVSWKDLGVQIRLEQPECVGLDRLLNVVAAMDRVNRFISMFIIDAGSAVTVDWIDDQRSFRGGVIFPGCRLMAKALHDYTAALPLVEIDGRNPPLPGDSTVGAIRAGIYWAVAGGIKASVRQLAARSRCAKAQQLIQSRLSDPEFFLTGGDAKLLAPVMDSDMILWPEMTLEGIRIAAEALP